MACAATCDTHRGLRACCSHTGPPRPRSHYPTRLKPSLPHADCLLLRAAADSWMDPGWRHSEERQHTVVMNVLLRTLLGEPQPGVPSSGPPGSGHIGPAEREAVGEAA
jgi:hypothetical protein